MDNTKKNFFQNINKIFEGILKQLGVIFLYVIILAIFYTIFQNFLESNNFILKNVTNIFIELIILIIFLLIFRKTIIPDFYSFKKEAPKYLKKYAKYWLIGLIIMIISNAIIGNIIGMPENEKANRNLFNELPIYSTLALIIFAPIIEELLTRAILKDTFKNKWIYILISGFIFGFLHCTSFIIDNNLLELLFIIPYGALGSVFAYIYYESNNIWTNISFHALHNLLGLSLIILTGAL